MKLLDLVPKQNCKNLVENAIELPKQRVLLFTQPKLYLRNNMKVKGNTYKANQPPLRTIVVEQDGKFITHVLSK